MDIPDKVYGVLSSVVEKSAIKSSQSAYSYNLEQKRFDFSGEKFNAGFSSAQITPQDINKKHYWLAGYKTGNRITGVIDPITVNAMWLDCGEKDGLLFVSADLIGLTGADVNDIRAQLGEFCSDSGCKGIVVSCTHTHASPDTVGYWGKLPISGKNKSYMTMVKASIKSVCISAYNNRKPGKLYNGFIRIPEMAKSGRKPYFYDDRLTRLRFVPDDGSDEIWYLNFSAHPNTTGADNSSISADYPAYIRKTINREKKVNVLFSVGATATVDIANIVSDRRERVKKAGEYIGHKVLSIESEIELKPEIKYVIKPYVVPIDNKILYFMKMINAVNSNVTADERSDIMSGLVTEIDYIQIDSLKILTIPGEAFASIIHKNEYNENPVCDLFKDDNLVAFGVTNDMIGYIVPEKDFVLHNDQPYLKIAAEKNGDRHYNETNSLGKLSEQAFVTACSELAESLK